MNKREAYSLGRVGGVGESAMRAAGEAVVKALGYKTAPYLVRHA